MKFSAAFVTLAVVLATANAAPIQIEERDPLSLSAKLGSKPLGSSGSLSAGLTGGKGSVNLLNGALSGSAGVKLPRDPLSLSAKVGSKPLGSSGSLSAGLTGGKGSVNLLNGLLSGSAGVKLPRDEAEERALLSASLSSAPLGTSASAHAGLKGAGGKANILGGLLTGSISAKP